MDVMKRSYCLNLLDYQQYGILLSSSSIAVLDCKPSRKFLYPNATTYHNAWWIYLSTVEWQWSTWQGSYYMQINFISWTAYIEGWFHIKIQSKIYLSTHLYFHIMSSCQSHYILGRLLCTWQSFLHHKCC